MIRLLYAELRLMLAAYRKIIIGLVLLFAFCALTAMLILSFPERTLFAKFTIGIVDNDNSAEIALLLEMLKEIEPLNNSVSFKHLSDAQASEMLYAGEIPAYIIVPPNFTEGVITGENLPLTIIGNESSIIQLSVTKLLLRAGIAFLTTSQAGVYSTLEYAYSQGMSWSDIVNYIVMPINIEYLKALTEYDGYFSSTEIMSTDGLSKEEYYLNSALFFLLSIFAITLLGTLIDTSAPVLMQRYRVCGIPLIKVMLAKWISLMIFFAALLLPWTIIIGFYVLAASPFLASLTLLCALLFTSEQAAGLFLFSFAVITAFASGGMLPLSYLPDIFGKISPLIPNFWFIRINNGPLSTLVLSGYAIALFGLTCTKTLKS